LIQFAQFNQGFESNYRLLRLEVVDFFVLDTFERTLGFALSDFPFEVECAKHSEVV
jgi:hypothetical protein